MYAIMATARTSAGTNPPAKSAATDTSAMAPMMIIKMQGGTRMPMAQAEPTPDPADQSLTEPDQADSNAAGFHQGARQNEQWNRQEDEGICGEEDLLDDNRERILAAPPQPQKAGHAYRERHGYCQDQQHHEGSDGDSNHRIRPRMARQSGPRPERIIRA